MLFQRAKEQVIMSAPEHGQRRKAYRKTGKNLTDIDVNILNSILENQI